MKDIKSFEGLYAVTSCGKVWSYRSKKFLAPRPLKNGYQRVQLRGQDYLIHRLVAEAYLQNPDNLPEVNHKDKNKNNNCLNNLEWCDRQHNIAYSHNKAVRNVETGEIFDSFMAAAASVNREKSGISACIRDKQKTCGGYHWEMI